jgi:hypothetical protein
VAYAYSYHNRKSKLSFGEIARAKRLVDMAVGGLGTIKQVEEPLIPATIEAIEKAQNVIETFLDNGTHIWDGGHISLDTVDWVLAQYGEGIKWLIVDGLNNIGDLAQSEYERVTNAAHKMEGLALTYNIPIVATAQIGRNTKGRTDKFIKISDGRGSGAIEEKGHAVIGMNNPWNLVDLEEMDERDVPSYIPKGHVWFKVLKLRDGIVGKSCLLEYAGGAGFYEKG